MNDNILVFDTETIGLEKRFCYDLGYGIYNKRGERIKELYRQGFIRYGSW